MVCEWPKTRSFGSNTFSEIFHDIGYHFVIYCSNFMCLTLQHEFSGSHGGTAGDKSLLGFDTVLLGKQFPTFRKIAVPARRRELLA